MTTFANIALKRIPLTARLIKYVDECCVTFDQEPLTAKYFDVAVHESSASDYFAAVRMRGLTRAYHGVAIDNDPYCALFTAFARVRDLVDTDTRPRVREISGTPVRREESRLT